VNSRDCVQARPRAVKLRALPWGAGGACTGASPLLHPAAVFRSPMAFRPYEGAPMVALILNTVIKVFEDFAYHRQLVAADGLNVVLEFSARVGDRQLKGIDMIRFDEAGRIIDFEVMIRPLSGLQALGEEMGRRLAPFLTAKSR